MGGLLAEERTQLIEAARGCGLHRPDGDVQVVGHLAFGQVQQVAQDDDAASALGQLEQRSDQGIAFGVVLGS